MQPRAVTAAIATGLLGLAACARQDAPPPVQQLDAAAQRVAAEKIASSFAEVCLNAIDLQAALRDLEAQGWPRFVQVWNQPDSVFYAARPSAALPAGLFVVADRPWPGRPIAQLTCVGHYGAADAAPMLQALERRWGKSQPGPSNVPGARAWAYRLAKGALSPIAAEEGPVGPTSAAAAGALGSGEAIVYAQVSYSAALKDVASLIVVRRAAR
jgi:hypothetical protein